MKTLFKNPLNRRRSARTAVNSAELRRMPGALPPAIASRLEALSARVLHVSWAEGLLWLAVAACALVLAQGAADWLFDLPRRVRILFLLADLAVFGFLIFTFGVQPWRRRLTPEDAALYAERHWPDLRTGLISVVQLARRPEGSPFIVKALLERMAARILRFDLRLAVRATRLRKLVMMALILALVTGGLIGWLAPKSLILLQRILLSNQPLPTETIVVAVSKDFSVPIGQTIELSAQATGVVPRSGRVEVTYVGKRPEMVGVSPKASSPDVFSLQLANIQQPLTYRFYLNDGRGEEWKVGLMHPPVLQEIKFEVTYPPYTGLPPTQLSPGGLSLLAGSKLKISGKSSQPLKAGRLVLTGVERSIDLKPEGENRTELRTEVDVPKEGLNGFWIELKNDQDVLSQANTVYALEIVPDKSPEIILADRQPDRLTMIPDQNPTLRFEVRDNFKIKEVFLCIQPLNSLGEGEEPDPEKAKQIPIALPQPAAAMNFNFVWKHPGESVDWVEGQSFTYWIKAIDNNDVTGPGITYTSPRQWSVVSLQTKREELAEQLRKHAESIKDLSGAQEGARSELGEILKQDKSK